MIQPVMNKREKQIRKKFMGMAMKLLDKNFEYEEDFYANASYITYEMEEKNDGLVYRELVHQEFNGGLHEEMCELSYKDISYGCDVNISLDDFVELLGKFELTIKKYTSFEGGLMKSILEGKESEYDLVEYVLTEEELEAFLTHKDYEDIIADKENLKG